MKIVVLGSAGFIGKNLCVALHERGDCTVLPITRQTSIEERDTALLEGDVVVHLAGVNRPKDPAEFQSCNADLTAELCAAMRRLGRSSPVVFASSVQAERDNPYGNSKRIAEEHLYAYADETGATAKIFRLPNVFGKWCQPNYNSVVATFCHSVVHGVPLTIHDPSTELRLVHIDDVVAAFVAAIFTPDGLPEVP